MADTKLSEETNEITTFDGDERLIICDDPTGTPEDGFVKLSTILSAAAANGWAEVSDTWTYASATTITVPTGAVALYQKGDYLRLKQSAGTYKYWAIYSVADTLVTIIENTDYTLANEAIADVAISRAANPLGWPGWFNWTPTITASGSMTIVDSDITLAKYCPSGRSLVVNINITFETGGTANNSIYTSSPCPLAATGRALSANVRDATSGTPLSGAGVTAEISAAWQLVARKGDASNFGIGAGRQVQLSGTVEMG